MKNIAIVLSMILSMAFSLSVMAQDNDMSREEKKKARQEETRQNYEETKEILESKKFVLEATFIGNKYGERVPVSSTLNFIMVDSSDAVFQLGNNSGMGYNGVGGITTDGPVTDWELDKNDKKKTFSLKMNVMTTLGNYDVIMDISSDGYATATLYGITRGQLVYTGQIVAKSESYVYKGYPSY